jgi:hypothetical protein
MESDQHFWCAWIESTDVLAVRDLIAPRVAPLRWTIVTMLDSNKRVAELTAVRQLLMEHQGRVVTLGDAVLLNSDAFSALQRHKDNFFTGYDELWMTREKCSSLEKPPRLRISAEQAISESHVPGLGRWMKENGLCVGLGDGFGTNIATRDVSVVDILTRAYGDAIHVADAEASW